MANEDIRESSVPLHAKISDRIRNAIYMEELERGQKLPSESEMMTLYGTSRGTIQQALRTLVDEGLITKVRGKGSFVAGPVLSYPTGTSLFSMSESLRLQGVQFKTQVLEQRVAPCTHSVAEHLQAPVGSPYLILRRLRSTTAGDPLMLMMSQVSLTVCPGLDKVDFTQETLFSAMEQASRRKIAFARLQYGARIAGTENGALLSCDPKAPVLNILQVVHVTGNVPVEWANLWLPANKYVLSTVQPRA
ncbi:GntR family transcriptional regulator [Atopobium sp. oral taxon 810]|uniref:GntR family transcriptional regulator n=1 Tax=Atopobium sp. oral taxon 810 TaxID=712158 RepID=UPI000396C1D3|nr:GntR family transcriptional regulator [Atopobium sp. oral taxon 810]ERI05071.1 UbiC transcription regulator-associated domain protein [Atopobium sp. oral taxon 810 str. F0209]